MKEEDFKLAAVCLFVLTLSILFSMFVMPEKITDKVIQRLKRDYVPGPYEPGFDPDKVPPGSIKN
jgi:hypothetical protein